MEALKIVHGADFKNMEHIYEIIDCLNFSTFD